MYAGINRSLFLHPMKLLRRYMLQEMVVPFFLTLMLFTFVFLTGTLVKMADTVLNKGIGFLDVAKIIILAFPEIFSFTLPTSALAAVVLTLGGFAQNNELRAMKAMGINLISVITPVLAVAFLISLLALVFNDQVVTKASFAKRKVVKKILFKNPLALFEPNRFIKEFEPYIFHVKGVKDRRLEQVIIYQPQEGKPTRTIIAEYGEIVTSPDGDQLTLKLFNGTIDEPGAEELYKLDFETYSLPTIMLQSASRIGKKTREAQLYELLTWLRQDDPASVKDRLRHRTELHRKISFSLGTFVFVLVGLPIAMIVRHGELIWAFSVSMSVVVVYYVMYVWAGSVSINGLIPPELALWLPNAVLVGVGLYLLKRAMVS